MVNLKMNWGRGMNRIGDVLMQDLFSRTLQELIPRTLHCILGLALLFAGAAWGSEPVTAKGTAYFPGCDTAAAIIPSYLGLSKEVWEYCLWSQEKVLGYEREVLDKASSDIKRIILPHLKNTEWVYPVPPNAGTEPDEKQIEENKSACTANLAALRSGKFTLFPQPDAKSSEIGYKALGQRWEDNSARVGCIDNHYDTCRLHNPFRACDSPPLPGNAHARFYKNPIDTKREITWMYGADRDQIFLVMASPMNPEFASEKYYLIATEESNCESKIISPNDGPLTGDGEMEETLFTEQAFGLIEIDGTLFAIAGGVVAMSENDRLWRRSEYEPLRLAYYDFSNPYWQPTKPDDTAKQIMEQATGKKISRMESARMAFKLKLSPSQQEVYDKNGLWPARVLDLYPLRASGKNSFEHCMWNIHE